MRVQHQALLSTWLSLPTFSSRTPPSQCILSLLALLWWPHPSQLVMESEGYSVGFRVPQCASLSMLCNALTLLRLHLGCSGLAWRRRQAAGGQARAPRVPGRCCQFPDLRLAVSAYVNGLQEHSRQAASARAATA